MKTRFNLFAVLTIITLALSLFVPSSIAQTSKSINKNELKVPLKTAKEPPEHRKIAEYYRQETQRLTADAKYHQEMGEVYKNAHLPYESKHPYGTIGVSHCQYWADLDLKQAKEAEALAALHEDMAKAAEQKQQ
jgi:hypothetical protein